MKKIGKIMTRCDPVDPAKPGQKPGCNQLTFFLLKRHRFEFFFKIGIDLNDPVKTRNPSLGPGRV
jgi:hypothetical protein